MSNRRLAVRGVLLLAFAFPALLRAATIEPALLAALQQQGKAEFVIQLAEKADLSAVQNAASKEEKGERTVAALKAAAARSQPAVSALLDARGMAHRGHWVANAIVTQGTLADVQALAALPQVAAVFEVRSNVDALSPYIRRQRQKLEAATARAEAENYGAKAMGIPEDGILRVHAPEVWALGFTGKGVVVGDHDIGVQWDHPALKKKYRGWDEATQKATHAYNWRNAFGAADAFYCPDPGIPCDPNSHGTHTTGTMVGDDGAGNRIGMAPDAKWMACRSLYDDIVGAGTVPTYLDCMEWMLAPYPDGDSAAADVKKAPDVVNNSWGCLEACAPPVLKDVNDATYAAGILQVVSAGNDGQGTIAGCSTIIAPPAVYESSFTVGASEGKSDEMADFSSLGPVLDDGSMRLKPNISAPGVATRSSIPTNAFGNKSGTSMAGPHVAGAAALLMSAEPRMKGRVAEMRTLLERTAVAAVGVANTQKTCGGTAATVIPNNIFGYGRLDALAAVVARPRLALALTAPATAKPGDAYEATLTVTQPATGKIDVTKALVEVSLPSAVTVVGSTPAPAKNTATGETRTLQYSVAKLEPGKSATVKLLLKADAAGDVALASRAEADQVSPLAGPAAKTAVSSGTTVPVPSAAATEDGRFGGGFGLAVLVMLGGAAALRRRRPA